MKKLAPRNSIVESKESIFLVLILLFLLTIKVLFLMYANPLPDEAYYWLWSKNIALSYFDHPPLVSWFQALLSFFSNNKYFLIRALPIFNLIAVVTIVIVWQQYILGKFDFRACLQTVVLFLSFPIFAIFFSISFPDYLLITLLFGTSFCLFLYFERNDIFYILRIWMVIEEFRKDSQTPRNFQDFSIRWLCEDSIEYDQGRLYLRAVHGKRGKRGKKGREKKEKERKRSYDLVYPPPWMYNIYYYLPEILI